MNDDEVVEVLDLRTLNHDRLADMHELIFDPARNEAFLEPADGTGGVIDNVCLNYSHSYIPP